MQCIEHALVLLQCYVLTYAALVLMNSAFALHTVTHASDTLTDAGPAPRLHLPSPCALITLGRCY